MDGSFIGYWMTLHQVKILFSFEFCDRLNRFGEVLGITEETLLLYITVLPWCSPEENHRKFPNFRCSRWNSKSVSKWNSDMKNHFRMWLQTIFFLHSISTLEASRSLKQYVTHETWIRILAFRRTVFMAWSLHNKYAVISALQLPILSLLAWTQKRSKERMRDEPSSLLSGPTGLFSRHVSIPLQLNTK